MQVSVDKPNGGIVMRGFIMSLDALMAAITTIVMLSVVAGILASQSQENFKNEQMFSLAADTLSVMDAIGSLNRYVTLDSTSIQNDMQTYLDLLPAQYCGNVTVRIYSSAGGGSFNIQNSYQRLTSNCLKTNLTAQTSRVFMNYNPQRFGIADMVVWLR